MYGERQAGARRSDHR